jgi:hypothetical protein
MDGVPDDELLIVRLADAVAVLCELSPLYAAMIVSSPELSPVVLPPTIRLAVAVPAEPERLPVPRAVLPTEKVTVPVGVPLSLLVTVAVRVALPEVEMLVGLTVSVTVGVVLVSRAPVCQAVTKLTVSIEPRPLTWS